MQSLQAQYCLLAATVESSNFTIQFTATNWLAICNALHDSHVKRINTWRMQDSLQNYSKALTAEKAKNVFCHSYQEFVSFEFQLVDVMN